LEVRKLSEKDGEFHTRIDKESYEYYIPETPDKVKVLRTQVAKKIVEEAKQDFQKLIITRYGKESDIALPEKAKDSDSSVDIWESNPPKDAVEFHMVDAEKFIETFVRWFGNTK
jgi:hypothetical protein